MPSNSDYNITTTNKDETYNIKLIQGEISDTTVVINGITYSVLSDKEQSEAVKKILNSISLESLSSIEDLSNRIKLLSDLPSVKTHSISMEILATAKEKQLVVENGLVPRVQSPDSPAKTVSIAQRMQELGVPGVSVAVIDKGKILWSSAYGELNKPTLIQAASISKTITALTVLSLIGQCQEAKKKGVSSGLKNDITLDTDVSTLLDEDLWRSIDPDERTKGNQPKMTIRCLLSHTAGTTVSGFNGYPRLKQIEKDTSELNEQVIRLEATQDRDPSDSKNLQNLKERLQKLKNIRSEAFKELPTVDQILRGQGNSEQVKIVETPDSTFTYSGGGTTILQKVIEVVTGQNFEKIVEEKVFKKLEMGKSTYSPKESDTCHGNDTDCSPIPGRWNAYPELAAAGLWTTPTDLAKMIIGIQQSITGGGMISQELAKSMITPQTEGIPNGLGVFVEQTPSSKYFFHGGVNLGFRCMFIANLEGQGAVVMTNSDHGAPLYKEMIDSIAKTYEWRDAENLPMLQSPFKPEELAAFNTPIDREKWSGYTGKYQFEDHLVDVSLSNEKILVRVDQEAPFEVIPLTDNLGLFRVFIPGPTEILRFKQIENSTTLELYECDHQKVVL